jgi:oligopeptide/dipeptide ABC transporter ATP-binding protein
VMYAGRVAEEGPVEEVFRRPRHPYTQKLMAAFPNIHADRRTLDVIPGSPPDLRDPPPGWVGRRRHRFADSGRSRHQHRTTTLRRRRRCWLYGLLREEPPLIGYVLQQRAATRSRGRRWLVPFLILGVGAFALAELGLRVVPGAIPAAILDEFPHDLRQQIVVGDTPFGSSRLVEVSRDDGGPMLRVAPPDTVVWRPPPPIDQEFNAVEAITTDDTGFCNPPPQRRKLRRRVIVPCVNDGGGIKRLQDAPPTYAYLSPSGCLDMHWPC